MCVVCRYKTKTKTHKAVFGLNCTHTVVDVCSSIDPIYKIWLILNIILNWTVLVYCDTHDPYRLDFDVQGEMQMLLIDKVNLFMVQEYFCHMLDAKIKIIWLIPRGERHLDVKFGVLYTVDVIFVV